MTTYSFKHSIQNCSQTTADVHMVTIDSNRKSPPPYPLVLSTTYRSPTIPHNWLTIVRYYHSRSSKISNFHLIWKPVCDFLL